MGWRSIQEALGSYALQNWLFMISIWATAVGMISGLLLLTYAGSSWMLGSLISPVFRAHTAPWQTVIGVISGAIFTSIYALLTT